MRTDQNRYALIKILGAAANQLEFMATVWDPPYYG